MNGLGHKWYFISLLLVMTLCVWYVKQRKLEERLQEHRDSQAAVQTLQAQVESLQQEVDHGKQRVQDLASDPVEQEAAIRRWSGKLREGEKVVHVEMAPEPEAAPAALPPGEHGTAQSN
jgi:uncharacterized protein YlxW (UPF0749 family)